MSDLPRRVEAMEGPFFDLPSVTDAIMDRDEAEKVREAEAIRDHATQQDEARTQEYWKDSAKWWREARTQPEWGDREEALRRKRKAADKRQPETGHKCERCGVRMRDCTCSTGQPGREPYKVVTSSDAYRFGAEDERRRIVALIEGKRKRATATAKVSPAAIVGFGLIVDEILTAIQEDTDE